jgi:hypothetical protein
MHNCKKNSTTAKFYVGILEEISTTAKKMAQLRNKMYNCKKKAQLRNTFIAVVHFLAILNYRTNSTFHFSFPFLLISTLPRHPSTAVNKLPPADAASHCLSRATSLFYFCYIPLPSVGSQISLDITLGISTSSSTVELVYSIRILFDDTS